MTNAPFVQRLYYVANSRFPTEKAHGVQIAKTCEALANEGVVVELVVPSRKNIITTDPFEYYCVRPTYTLKRLPTLDLLWMGRVGFWIQSLTFAMSVCVYMWGKEGVCYSRDEMPLYTLSFLRKGLVWESHTGRYNFLVRRLFQVGVKVVVITRGLETLYRKKHPHASMVVAPDGVDLTNFKNPESKESARARLGLPSAVPLALYVGRLDGWKGVETLLEAAQYLPHVTVALIGGEASQVSVLKERYRGVHFLGYRPYMELADNQAAADVLVLPNTGKDETSVQYTSPLKLFSYMAAGKPIVASDLPSLREVIDEESAVFFKPDDPRSLAAAIDDVLANPKKAEQTALRARLLVEHFTWDKRVQGILTFITHSV